MAQTKVTKRDILITEPNKLLGSDNLGNTVIRDIPITREQKDFEKNISLEYHVRVNGDITNDGSFSSSFSKIEEARDAIRQYKIDNGGLPKGNIVVWVHEGNYDYSDGGVVFEAQDSGTEDSPIFYKSYNNGKVTFSGGKTVDFSQVQTPPTTITDRLDNSIASDVRMINISDIGLQISDIEKPIYLPGNGITPDDPMGRLYINNKRLPFSTYPQRDGNGNPVYITTGTVINPGSYPRGSFVADPTVPTWVTDDSTIQGYSQFDGFEYVYGFFSTDDNPTTPEAGDAVPNDFIPSQIEIANYDSANDEITLSNEAWYAVGQGDRYYILNKLEELRNPNDMVYDYNNGIFYFVPPSGFNSDSEISISAEVTPIVTLESDYIRFEGIDFSLSRAEDVIDARNSSYVTFKDFEINNAEGNALKLSESDVVGNKVINYTSQSIARSPLLFGGGNRLNQTNSDTYAINIKATDFGKDIRIRGVGTKLLHFELNDCPGIGVTYGGNHIEIGYGKFSNITYDVSDFGYIYGGGNNGETDIYIHDIYADQTTNITTATGTQVVYIDDNGGFVKVENVISNGAAAGNDNALFKANGGAYNEVSNVIALNGDRLGWFNVTTPAGWSSLWAEQETIDDLAEVNATDVNSVWYRQNPIAFSIIGNAPESTTNTFKNSLHIGTEDSFRGIVDGSFADPNITTENITKTTVNPFPFAANDDFYLTKQEWESEPSLSDLNYIDFSKFGIVEELTEEYINRLLNPISSDASITSFSELTGTLEQDKIEGLNLDKEIIKQSLITALGNETDIYQPQFSDTFDGTVLDTSRYTVINGGDNAVVTVTQNDALIIEATGNVSGSKRVYTSQTFSGKVRMDLEISRTGEFAPNHRVGFYNTDTQDEAAFSRNTSNDEIRLFVFNGSSVLYSVFPGQTYASHPFQRIEIQGSDIRFFLSIDGITYEEVGNYTYDIGSSNMRFFAFQEGLLQGQQKTLTIDNLVISNGFDIASLTDSNFTVAESTLSKKADIDSLATINGNSIYNGGQDIVISGGGSSNPNEFVPTTSTDFTSPNAANANKIWLIQNDIDLGGAVSDLPDGVELRGAGGSLVNGTINLPKGRIDPFLLNYQLTVNEGQMYPTTYIFDPEKVGIVEQSTDFTDCENNRLRFNHIIKEVNKLKGNKISIGTLDAYFVVEIQLNRIKDEAEQELAIMFQSDIHYDLSEDTFLRVRPDNSFGSKLIHVFRCHGVKITGGNLMGDRFTHDYSPVNDSNGAQRNSHEFGTLLQISGSNYVTVENVRMEDSTADCIIIDGTSIRNADGTLIDGERISEDVVVRGCYLSQGRRNNISVLDGERIVIENNIITGAGNGFTPLDDNVINAAGRLPRTGIDIEPYQEPGTGEDSEKFEDVANVIVRNNEFTKNYNADVNVFKGERILLENNRGTNILNCQFSNQVSVRNNSVRFDDTLVGGNVGTPKNGIQINNFLRVNAGGSFELVFANIIEGNTIRDFPGGISFDGRDAKVLNNNVYNSSIHGIELTDGENSQVRGNSIISDVTGVRGITSANGDCRAIVESNIIQISDGVGVYLSDVNDEDATSSKRIRIRRNTIKSPTIIDARNVYGLHFNENDIDLGGMELENIYNFEINRNKTLNTIPDRFINHFNNLVNGKIEDNVAVSSSTSTMTFNSSASAAIQNVIFNGNELENLTGSNVLGIFLNAVNNSNITISNNVFKKDANQNDILARAENKIIYGNYSVDGSPLKYSLEGTNTIFDDYSLINGTSQFVTQTTVELENSSRDLDLDDVNEIIYSGAGNPTFTIPNSSSVSWIPGQTIEFINDSSFNTITIIGSSGVIIKDNGLGNVISENGERKRLTYYKNNNWVLYGDRTIRENEIIVKRPEQLEGVLQSDKIYFLDGFINVNTIDISIPAGGATFTSYGIGLGGLTTNVTDDTIFISPAGGSGDLVLKNMSITGNNADNSSIFALTDIDGTHSIRMESVELNSYRSLGYLDGYRQGLEQNTNRIAGRPTLEFRGVWTGGYFLQNSTVRGIDNLAYNLFQSEAGQTFASRFGGNLDIVLPANVTAFNFTESNFVTDELLQLDNATFSGTGTIFSGLDETSVKVRVSKNTRGTSATYVGGSQDTTTTALTTITTQNTLVPIEGTKTYSNLTWFSDGGANDALTYTSTQPSNIRVFYKGSFIGTNNTTYEIVIRHWDDSASAYVDIETATFTTNGGTTSDIAEGISFPTPRFVIDTNDRVEKWIRNITNTNDITERLNSKLIIEE